MGTRHTLLAALSAAVTAVAAVAAFVVISPSASASTQLCGATSTVAVNGGEYIVQNNIWGASTPQCITANGASFTVDSSGHNLSGGAPASYPSIYKGCHWGLCTTNSGLPQQVGSMAQVTSSWSTTQINSGTYDVAYDIWYNSQPSTSGQPDGAEVMVWLNSRGGVQPAGSKIASNVSISGSTWDVWYDRMSWNYIAYVRTSGTTSISNLDINAVTRDGVSRGYIQNAWYLLDVEAGFELWQGGAGLATNSFSVNVGGGTTSTTTTTTTTTTTSQGGGGGGCSASLHVDNAWDGGFTATVTVTNSGSSPLSGWTANWNFPGSQTITSSWNAQISQSGTGVQARNMSYNGSLAPGGSTSFGFQGTGSNPGTPAVHCAAS